MVKFSHGSEKKQMNPVNDVCFYSKANPWKPISIPDTKVPQAEMFTISTIAIHMHAIDLLYCPTYKA